MSNEVFENKLNGFIERNVRGSKIPMYQVFNELIDDIENVLNGGTIDDLRDIYFTYQVRFYDNAKSYEEYEQYMERLTGVKLFVNRLFIK